MTVIVIISILAGMLFTVVLGAQKWAREKKAMMEVNNIVIALKAYRALYGYWPNQTQSQTDTCYYAKNAPVIAALTNNPRSEIVLQFQQSSISNGSYLDPWLHPYVIVMDENGDNKVTFKTGSVILTNLSGKVTTNKLDFSVDVSVGVVSWGDLNTSNSGSVNMDLSSWQSGTKTK